MGGRVFATIARLRGRNKERAAPASGRGPLDQNGASKAPRKELPGRLLCRAGVHLGDVVPVHQVVDEGLEVVGPAVAVVDVIGVFPYVTTEDRLGALNQRALAVGGLHDDDL